MLNSKHYKQIQKLGPYSVHYFGLHAYIHRRIFCVEPKLGLILHKTRRVLSNKGFVNDLRQTL